MFSMKRPTLRERRRARLAMLRTVTARVEVGLDLAYAWPEADPTGHFADRLRAEDKSDPIDALWLPVLAELYEAGAPMRDALSGWQTSLAEAQTADVERFCRERPERVSVVLLLFYLPAAFLILFPPLLASLP